MSEVETQPPEEAPDKAVVVAPAEGGQGVAEEKPSSVFEDNFDEAKLPEELRSEYRKMRGDYTRKTQELAQQRQEAEAAQSWLKAFNDPQTKDDAVRQFLEANGLTLEEAEALEQEELSDAQQAQARLDRLEQAEQQRELQSQANELEANLIRDLEAADTGTLKMDDKDTNWILDRVIQHLSQGQEVPVQSVVDEYRQLVERHVNSYVESKKAPRTPSPGQAGSQLPDNTERGRSDRMAAIIAAEQ